MRWRVSAAASTWAATLRTTRATVRRRIEGWSTTAPSSSRAPRTTKKSGTKNPSASPRTWVNSRFGAAERGDEQAGAEARDEDAGAALLRDPRQREEDEQRQAQIERPAALLRALAQAGGPVLSVGPVGDEIDGDGAGGDQRAPLRRVRDAPGLEHEGDREDRDDVGDRDLPDHRERRDAGEARLGDHRQDGGGRARAEDDRVERGVPGAGERRRGQASKRRQQQHDARREPTAAQRGGQAPIAQRDVRADGEHQHREAHVAEEEHGGVRRVDRVEARASDDHAREDLADHQRDEHAAPGAEQRAGQAREHDQRQNAEVHRLRLRA